MTYRLLAAAVWVGGHLVLSISVLPRALRTRDPGIIRGLGRRIGLQDPLAACCGTALSRLTKET